MCVCAVGATVALVRLARSQGYKLEHVCIKLSDESRQKQCDEWFQHLTKLPDELPAKLDFASREEYFAAIVDAGRTTRAAAGSWWQLLRLMARPLARLVVLLAPPARDATIHLANLSAHLASNAAVLATNVAVLAAAQSPTMIAAEVCTCGGRGCSIGSGRNCFIGSGSGSNCVGSGSGGTSYQCSLRQQVGSIVGLLFVWRIVVFISRQGYFARMKRRAGLARDALSKRYSTASRWLRVTSRAVGSVLPHICYAAACVLSLRRWDVAAVAWSAQLRTTPPFQFSACVWTPRWQ